MVIGDGTRKQGKVSMDRSSPGGLGSKTTRTVGKESLSARLPFLPENLRPRRSDEETGLGGI